MREEMFKMTQKEDEILEDYLERFHYIVKRVRKNHLDLDTLKVNVLNLMGKGDISHLTYPEICDLCMNSKYGKGPREDKSAIHGVSRVDIGNLLDNIKIYILSTLGSQLETIENQAKERGRECILNYLLSKM
jgi:hypothetical protein